jgi:four helix bundle protein
MNNTSNSYDLENRTAKFGEEIVKFCKNIQQDAVIRPLISQIIRSATSIGANYMEANGAASRKDFKNKISICRKEAQETKHWLRMMTVALPNQENNIKALWQESQELSMIFGKIFSSLNK